MFPYQGKEFFIFNGKRFLFSSKGLLFREKSFVFSSKGLVFCDKGIFFSGELSGSRFPLVKHQFKIALVAVIILPGFTLEADRLLLGKLVNGCGGGWFLRFLNS